MNYQCESQHVSTSLNEFTDDEIREQLEYLGFKNVSKDKFNQFKNDLEKLIAQEVSINSNANNSDIFPSHAEHFDNQEFQNDQKLYKNKKVTFPDDSHLVDRECAEDNENDCDQSFASIVTTSSIVDNKVIKRKIIRKNNNNNNNDDNDLHQASNQSNYLSASRDINEKLNINEDEHLEFDDFDDDLDEQDEQLVQLNECYPPVQFPMKSFIRSQSSLSNRSDASRISLKSNPVNKFHEYNKLWSKQKMPGEKKHNELRWSIREQMLTKDVIVKRQHKTYEPNVYTIPTDKKRQQLRWAVRNALANQF